MRILITAGNTEAPIDRVRCITNIFTGRTGAAIAHCARGQGHGVRLLTSHPERLDLLHPRFEPGPGWQVMRYRAFFELNDLLARSLAEESWDAVIHCAAVSDYLVDGAYEPLAGRSQGSPAKGWTLHTGPQLTDGKIKSQAPELWLRLTRAPKLIDRIRTDWGFEGVLVKFKLEVDVSEDRLLTIAETSRLHSWADLMVANTLEGASEWALIGPLESGYERVRRGDLPARLLQAIGERVRETDHG